MDTCLSKFRASRTGSWSMRFVQFTFLLACTVHLQAQILHYAELNTVQVQSLDRAHTVVILTDGILEEHGPYLPSFSDGYWDEAITDALAKALVERPGWTVVLLPTLPIGTNPANVVAGKWSFPGSLDIRFETMRSVMMDLADSLGEQGFRWVFIVDSHGGPTQSIALDAASDYFHDTYHGEMLHLLGVMTIVDCCKALEESLTAEQLEQNGMSIHADALEQSQVLFVKPELSPPAYKQAPAFAGKDFDGLTRVGHSLGWPGYFGAPAYASAALGARFFRQQTTAVNALAISVIEGKADPRSIPRYGNSMFTLTHAAETPMLEHEAEVAAKHLAWLKAHPQPN